VFMGRTLYIETSVPSSYYDERLEPEMVARKHWTRKWWDRERGNYSLFTSMAVIEELRKSIHPSTGAKVSLVEQLPALETTPEVEEIAEVYIRRFVMPADPTGDALHLALASFHRIDILLTWNCVHLANENKMPHIRRTNALMGLWTPEIVTPMNLLEDETP